MAASTKLMQELADVIDSFSPSVEITVTYGSTAVNLNELKPAQAQRAPTVRFAVPDANERYTLVMTDPGKYLNVQRFVTQ